MFPGTFWIKQKNNYSGEVCIKIRRLAGLANRPQVTPMLSLISKKSGERMPMPMLQHIPLASAYLCQDCNCIGNCARQCPACASEVLMGLAGVLNREVEQVSTPQYGYEPALVA
jgi:hypothetical protein